MTEIPTANEFNRLANCKNPYQGDYKKVLCVCSAGLLRSPTAALVLSQEPFNFNTRAAGMVPQFALIAVDKVLVTWADEIVCMEDDHRDLLDSQMEKGQIPRKPIKCLHIQDSHAYRSEDLQWLIKEKYKECK